MKRTIYNFMGIRFLLLCFSLSVILPEQQLLAQLSSNELPYTFTSGLLDKESFEEKAVLGVPTSELLKKEDLQDSLQGLPPRFGYPLKVALTIDNAGTWEDLPDGGKLWRLGISCMGARSINLLYDAFWLPENSKLFLYDGNKKQSIGAFTSRNNKGDKNKPGKFATGLIFGGQTTLEYYQAPGVQERPILSIAQVVYGYRSIELPEEQANPYFGTAKACHININCVEGESYQREKRAVALILVEGSRWCSGSLINTTSNNLEPYLLTADHCLGTIDAVANPDAGYWSFYWNYESPTCTNPTSAPGFYSTSGASVVANYKDTDMALLRLLEDPQELATYAPVYLGWSRATTAPLHTVGIHHPRGDVKKISISNEPSNYNTSSIAWQGGQVSPIGSHWVVQITAGTTEGGSSGSMLLDQDKLIIGQLHGGADGCAPVQKFYGSFDKSWEDGPIPQRRLRDWLDPTQTNALRSGTHE